MIKRILTVLTAAFLAVTLLAGCTNNSDTSDSSGQTEINTIQSSLEQTNDNMESIVDDDFEVIQTEYSSADNDSEYDGTSATKITLIDGSTEIDGSGASEKNDVITISEEREYIITGTLSDGQIVVDAPEKDVVQIILNDASVTSKSGCALYVKKAEKLVLTLAEGSVNTFEDAKDYDDESEDAPDAAIYAGEDLTINGTGSLSVTGNYKSGIKSVDDLVLMSGHIEVSAEADGIRGKDSLTVKEAVITIDSGEDGLKSNNDEDEDSGYIAIEGGQISITAGNTGLHAETGILITDGTLDITSGQDSLNCNGSIKVSGGSFTLNAGDDGMHANNALEIIGGTITITKSYEGLEAAAVQIAGGNISLAASDDGINAAGGSDSDMDTRDMFNDTGEYYVSIGGGIIYVNAGGDGIDSNGDIYISGGVTTVSGPEENMNSGIDIERGAFEITGGTLVVTSSVGMMVSPTQASQPVLTVVFDGSNGQSETYSLTDAEGSTVIAFTPVKSYQCVMITSEDLELGETYTFSSGGIYSGEKLNEVLYSGGSISGMDEMFTFSFSDYVTTLDQDGNATALAGGFGGAGGPGGMGGGKPGPR